MDEDDDDPVPLPNVNGAIMRKVGVLGGSESGRGEERGEEKWGVGRDREGGERGSLQLMFSVDCYNYSAAFINVLFYNCNIITGDRVGHPPQG